MSVSPSIRPSGCPFVRSSIRKCHLEKRLNLEPSILANVWILEKIICLLILSQFLTSWTYFFKTWIQYIENLVHDYLKNGDGLGKHCYYQQFESCIWPFVWNIYILPWWPWPILKVQVNVKHISTVYISKTVSDLANITIAIKYYVAYRLSINIFTFDCDSF